jgi:hypothetical protein
MVQLSLYSVGPWAGQPLLIPDERETFLDRPRGPPTFYTIGTGGSLPACEADHSI